MPTLLKMEIEELANGWRKLPADKHEFAQSLLKTAMRPNFPIGSLLSEKQAAWVSRLADMVEGKAPAAATPAAKIGSLDGIKALFARAAKHLKFPAIVLLIGPVDEDAMVRIYPAGAEGKNPGAIYIKDADTRAYLGKISPEGAVSFSRECPEHARKDITDVLTRLAADPAAVAAEHGRLTGRCCFCNIALKDERSTGVGYGPVCAEHYGLPWGERPAEFAAHAHENHAHH